MGPWGKIWGGTEFPNSRRGPEKGGALATWPPEQLQTGEWSSQGPGSHTHTQACHCRNRKQPNYYRASSPRCPSRMLPADPRTRPPIQNHPSPVSNPVGHTFRRNASSTLSSRDTCATALETPLPARGSNHPSSLSIPQHKLGGTSQCHQPSLWIPRRLPDMPWSWADQFTQGQQPTGIGALQTGQRILFVMTGRGRGTGPG